MASIWIKEVAENYLQFETTHWERCVNKKSEPRTDSNAIAKFLSADAKKGTTLFVYTTVQEEDKEVRVRRRRVLAGVKSSSVLVGEGSNMNLIKKLTSDSDPSNCSESKEADEVIYDELPRSIPPSRVSVESHPVATAESTLSSSELEVGSSHSDEVGKSINLKDQSITGIDVVSGDIHESKGDDDATVPAVASRSNSPSSVTNPATVESSEDEYEVITEIQTVKHTTVHMLVDQVPDKVHHEHVVYFIRTVSGPLVVTSEDVRSFEDPWSEVMCGAVEYGSLSEDVLGDVEKMFSEVYQPFLDPQLIDSKDASGDHRDEIHDDHEQSNDHDSRDVTSRPAVDTLGNTFEFTTTTNQSSLTPMAAYTDLSKLSDGARAEFYIAFHNLIEGLRLASTSLKSNVTVTIPYTDLSDEEFENLIHDPNAIAYLSEVVHSWTEAIQPLLAPVTAAQKGPNAISELDFWRRQLAHLFSLTDRFSRPSASRILALLESVGEECVLTFYAAELELQKKNAEAATIVRYLGTLERYFRAINTGAITDIKTVLPALFGALVVLHPVSSYISDPVSLAELLERISVEICERVASAVNLRSLVRMFAYDSPASAASEALATMDTCKKALESWINTFQSTQQQLLLQGKRWDVDSRLVLTRPRYIVSVLSGLSDLLSRVVSYRSFLTSRELVAVSPTVTTLLQLHTLLDRTLSPFVRASFPVFSSSSKLKWDSVCDAFVAAEQRWKHAVDSFLTSTLKTIKSASLALDLVLRVDDVPEWGFLRARLHANTAVIVSRAREDLAAASKLFQIHKDMPPQGKFSPPTASAIQWAQLLYLRQKVPVLKFRAVPSVIKSKEGALYLSEYLTFARTLDKYIKGKYVDWCKSCVAVVSHLTSAPLLAPALLPFSPCPQRLLLGRIVPFNVEKAKKQLSITYNASATAGSSSTGVSGSNNAIGTSGGHLLTSPPVNESGMNPLASSAFGSGAVSKSLLTSALRAGSSSNRLGQSPVAAGMTGSSSGMRASSSSGASLEHSFHPSMVLNSLIFDYSRDAGKHQNPVSAAMAAQGQSAALGAAGGIGSWLERLPPQLAAHVRCYIVSQHFQLTDTTSKDTLSTRLPLPPYMINFPPALELISREARFMDGLGFPIPEPILNVALQDPHLSAYRSQLGSLLDTYHSLLGSLSPIEATVLRGHLAQLRAALRPAFSPLSWASSHIGMFLQEFARVLSDFSSLLSQLRKQFMQLQEVEESISSTLLLEPQELEELDLSQFDINAVPKTSGDAAGAPLPEFRTVLRDVEDLTRAIYVLRTQRLEAPILKYKSTRTVLLQVEALVAGTATSASPLLGELYRLWERRLHNAIVSMILNSLTTLLVWFGLHPDSSVAPTPLFGVQVRFAAGAADVLTSPTKEQIASLYERSWTIIASSSEKFTRWLDGTCIEAEVTLAPRQLDASAVGSKGSNNAASAAAARDPPPDLTMRGSVDQTYGLVQLSLIKEPMVMSVMSKLRNITSNLKTRGKGLGLDGSHALAHGQLHSTSHGHGHGHGQMVHSRKYGSSMRPSADAHTPACLLSPPLLPAIFDQKLRFHAQLLDGLSSLPSTRQLHSMTVDISGVLHTIREHAIAMQAQMTSELFVLVNLKTNEHYAAVDELHQLVDGATGTVAGLRRVLTAVQTVLNLRDDMEALADSIQECLAVLMSHHALMPEADVARARAVTQRWRDLVDHALTRRHRLKYVIERARKETLALADSFADECEAFCASFEQNGPNAAGTPIAEGLGMISEYNSRVAAFLTRESDLQQTANLFSETITPSRALQSVEDTLQRIAPLYKLYSDFLAFSEGLSNTLWVNVDLVTLTADIDGFWKSLGTLHELKGTPPYESLAAVLKSFRESLPLIAALKSSSVKPRHWSKIGALSGTSMASGPKSFTFSMILGLKLTDFQEQVSEILNEAKQEAKIEKDLRSFQERWMSAQFIVVPQTSGSVASDQVPGLLRLDDVVRQDLEDNILSLQAISGSRYLSVHAPTAAELDYKLNTVLSVQELLFAVQTKWSYLSGVFAPADIRQQLPAVSKTFGLIDKEFSEILINICRHPLLVDACCQPGRLDVLQALSDKLDQCQKGLSDYLESKRVSFPRFYFISDDELLSVLGASEPTAVSPHLLKLFDNIKAFHWGAGNASIEALVSSEGEVADLLTPVAVSGPTENWLCALEAEMRRSLHSVLRSAVLAYAQTSRTQWIEDQLAMVVITGSQTWFTWEVVDTFHQVAAGSKLAMKQLAAKLAEQLRALTTVIRGDLPSLLRKKVNTLVIVDVHARDVVESFVRDSVMSASAFEWESQLRFAWSAQQDDIVISQCTGEFKYGYEYMGVNGRLVITPLTDRCYMTLTQALTFHLGGAPAGPAGTGKTETTKDLAKNIALPCFVINCGEGLDYRAMGSIFSGLLQIGAWGCFDEFNRISIEVLSVVSAQVKAIQNALHFHRLMVDIGTGELKLNSKVGIFITMNPGYAGRTELPDNLKALFRPVTMIVPDLLQICEIMLYSEGFDNAATLATKMTTLYALSRDQLSKQFHYDFGLRALKSVLVMAGALKREFADTPEDQVLMRSLRDSNVPKFVFEDVPLFLGLVNDLFPGLDCPRVGYPDLRAAAARELTARGFHHDDEPVFDAQVEKVVQLYEVMLTRHTTMVVGPTDGGKTVVLHTLQRALAPAQQVKQFVLNPKAQSVNELYGVLDPISREWTDGVLSMLFRTCNEPLPASKQDEVRWIVLDGDVDAVWVENMNSVMDDNKLLTLPNSERIRLQNHCKLLIEVGDLQYASPATVSRCGMLFVDPKSLGFAPYFSSWLRTRCPFLPSGLNSKPTESGLLQDLFIKYVPPLIKYITTGESGFIVDSDDSTPGSPNSSSGGSIEEPLDQVVPQGAMHMTRQLCHMLDALFDSPSVQAYFNASSSGSVTTASTAASAGAAAGSSDKQESTERKEITDGDALEGYFIFAIVWSLGATLETHERDRFNACLARIAGLGAPRGTNFFENFFDETTKHWLPWTNVVRPYEPPTPLLFHSIYVETADSARYSYLLRALHAADKRVTLIGASSTTKSMLFKSFLKSLPRETYTTLSVGFSARSTAKDVQAIVDSSVDRRSARVYAPPQGRRLLIIIDDMNFPRIDTYGTQQPLALLRHLLSTGTMYQHNKEIELCTYKSVDVSCAMTSPKSGANPVDPRFLSLFVLLALPLPSRATLMQMYGSVVGSFADSVGFAPDMKESLMKVTSLTLDTLQFVLDKLPPTPAKFHYLFSLRDVGRVVEGLLNARPDTVRSPTAVARFWLNEVKRTFEDRLSDPADVATVGQFFSEALKNTFGGVAVAQAASKEPLLFGDFLKAPQRLEAGEDDPRVYEDLSEPLNGSDVPAAYSLLQRVLDLHNDARTPMPLVLFDSAISHLCRILRILRAPRGSALLVGIGGSGKQSLARLATYAIGYRLFEISLARGYGENEFREDLKLLYSELLQGPCVFLLTDAQVSNDAFLELVSQMLSSGTVTALFEREEQDALAGRLRTEMKRAGVPDTREATWSFVVQRAHDNFHLLFCTSPSGDALRRRCRIFPGLLANTTIDYFFPWTSDALMKVGSAFLDRSLLPVHLHEPLLAHMVQVHSSVVEASKEMALLLRRRNYVTPKNYLDFVSQYNSLLKSEFKAVGAHHKRLSGGLSRLEEASVAVAALRVEVTAAKQVVDEKTVQVEELLQQIAVRKSAADIQSAEAASKEAELQNLAKVLAQEYATSNAALDSAMPALKAADEALANVDFTDLFEISKYVAPPEPVVELVTLFVHFNPLNFDESQLKEDWASAKAIISNSGLKKAMIDYKNNGIENLTAKRVRKLEARFGPGYEAWEARVVAAAAKSPSLLNWMRNMLKYNAAYCQVTPLKKRIQQLEKQQEKGAADLRKTMAELKKLNELLAELDEQYLRSSKELDQLRQQADVMTRKLTAAAQLIEGLSSEATRWGKDVENIGSKREQLPGNSVMAAAFLSYLGPFPFQFRTQLLDSWVADVRARNVPFTDGMNIESFLISEATAQLWASEGLPSDRHSVMNGVLTTRSARAPLCIDPQQQASVWLREHFPEMKVCSLSDSDFMQQLKIALSYGQVFMFADVDEELDPMIDPVLTQNTYLEGTQRFIKLDDAAIAWDDGFQLIMTTKLSNPHLSPEIMSKIQAVNYSLTPNGLEEQLLDVIFSNERPDLEVQYSNIVKEMGADSAAIEALEDSLLRALSSASADTPLVDNKELIQTLESTKSQSSVIAAKLAASKTIRADIASTRALYRPVAKRGSILYFSISGLSSLSSLYETSLASFLTVYRNAMLQTKKSTVLEHRLRLLISSTSRELYEYVCTGIFEKLKLTFSMEITSKILIGEGLMSSKDLEFFMKGDTSVSPAGDGLPDKPAALSWISNSSWKDLVFLCQGRHLVENSNIPNTASGNPFAVSLPQLSPRFLIPSSTRKLVLDRVLKNIVEQPDAWRQWYDLESPEMQAPPIPSHISNSGAAESKEDDVGYLKMTDLHPLDFLLLVRCLRSDRVYNATKAFVIQAMGEEYVQPPVLDYARLYARTSAHTPVVFILSPGADPQSDLQALGSQMGFLPPNRFRFVSLGQGQSGKAEDLLRVAAAKGYWILLQNTHLLISWMHRLEKLLAAMQPHPDFRLWMTTNPTEDFPLGLLQSSIKVVTEPPDGLKMNLRSTISRLVGEHTPSSGSSGTKDGKDAKDKDKEKEKDAVVIHSDNTSHPAFPTLVYVLAYLHAVLLERRKYGKIGFNVAYDFNESDFNVSKRLLSLYLTKSVENNEDEVPWASLRFLIGEAMYGGRVSDNYDRRILRTYLNEYFGSFIFDSSNQFFLSRAGFDFTLPNVNPSAPFLNNLLGFNEHVSKLPLINSPQVLGLGPNAEISYFLHSVHGMWDDLTALQPRVGGAVGGESPEARCSAILDSITSRLPSEEFDIQLIRRRLIEQREMDSISGPNGTVAVEGALSPIDVALLQELDHWNALLRAILVSCQNLKRALSGDIGMSEQLDALFLSLTNSKVPQQWLRLAPASQKPLNSWIQQLLRRHAQYTSWTQNLMAPAVVWLSGLHLPATFIAAMIQVTCRKYKWPLDACGVQAVATQYTSEDAVPHRAEEGYYVTGLYLEGASWDLEKSELAQARPKVLIEPLPVFKLVPIETSRIKTAGTIKTPVYVTTARKNAMGVGLVFEIDLPTRMHQSHWILQGVAVTLNTDD